MKHIAWIPCLYVVLSSGCILMFNELDLTTDLGPLRETTLMGSGKSRIVVVDVSGEISSAESRGFAGWGPGESMVSLVREQLEKAASEPRTRAVVVRINSPGGSVTASDQLHQELSSFRERYEIPLYAVMMDIAASGGYYVAMAADRVYAHPTTITGSIGVIAYHVNVKGLIEKIGIQSKALKSGERKDIGNPWRPLDPEEERILQTIVDEMFDRFVDVVKRGRPKLTREQIVEAADGRIYTADQAKQLGLIDGIGYLPVVLDELRQELNLDNVRVVMYHRPHQHVSNIYSQALNPPPKGLSLIDPELLESLTGTQRTQGFYYLWDPGGS